MILAVLSAQCLVVMALYIYLPLDWSGDFTGNSQEKPVEVRSFQNNNLLDTLKRGRKREALFQRRCCTMLHFSTIFKYQFYIEPTLS
uniref:Putative secreted protein n=1 Tax=Ixodes ricinus TaxID=34613 RepID=A0A6B0U8M5_IXORI